MNHFCHFVGGACGNIYRRARRADYTPLLLCWATAVFYCVLCALMGRNPIGPSGYCTYTLQALAWRDGQICLSQDYPWLELAIYQGKYFVSFPPVPSVPLYFLTFLFGKNTPDHLLVTLYMLFGLLAIYRMMRDAGYDKASAAGLSLLCSFGSCLLALVTSDQVIYLIGRLWPGGAMALAALLPSCLPVERAVRLEAAQASLTAAFYRMKGARPVRPALALYLIEETDRLYRFANLMDAEQEKPAESALDGLCEITPGRPCAAQHRAPEDALFEPLDFETAPHAAIYAVVIQSGVKRAVMRLYAEWTAMAQEEARPMFAEAALLLGEQAAAYASLWDAALTAAEPALWPRRAAG